MAKEPESNSASIYITGDIVSDQWYEDETSTTSFKDELDSLGAVDNIDLHINSGGGSVFDGIAIFNMLKSNQATITVYIDALAASIASVIAMAGDKIIMPSNSMLMIHNPWTYTQGNAKELRKAADDLDQIGKASRQSYLNKAGDALDEETLITLLEDETWLTAQQAVDYGLADEVTNANLVAASIDKNILSQYKHAPKSLLMAKQSMSQLEESEERKKIMERTKISKDYLASFLNTKIYKEGH